jgi:hypothetical protein
LLSLRLFLPRKLLGKVPQALVPRSDHPRDVGLSVEARMIGDQSAVRLVWAGQPI